MQVLKLFSFISISTAMYFVCVSCNTGGDASLKNSPILQPESAAVIQSNVTKSRHYRGALSNGMKGDSISFDVSADGKKLSNLTFKGYWRCSGKLEQLRAAGPEGTYDIINGRVDGHISEPPNGGSTAWRFDIKAVISESSAIGTFRMNINDLGCDSYLLNFTAVAD